MNKDCTSALYDILSENEVPEDSRHVLLCIIGSTKSPDKLVISDLFGGNEASENYTKSSIDDNVPLNDMRLMSIRLINIRSFYSYTDENKSEFGLTLSREDHPISLFLVGGNSTGKSSIFSAIEKFYTGNVSHAKAVNSDVINYMTYGFGQIKKAKVGYRVRTGCQSEMWESLQRQNDIATIASFCSDYDIERIEKSSENLNEFILEQLGYGDLFLLHNRIEQLLKGLKTNYEIGKQEFSSIEWTEIIEALILYHNQNNLSEIELYMNTTKIKDAISQGISGQIFPSRWAMLIKGSASAVNTYNVELGYADYMFSDTANEKDGKTSAERLAMMYQELYKRIDEIRSEAKTTVDVLDEMYMNKNVVFEKERKNAEMPISSENRKAALTTVSSLVKEKCDQILYAIYVDSHSFIEDILKRFSPRNEKYQFTFDKGVVSMVINVTTEKSSFTAKPQEYLNTFRFKLYCVTLKIALAFSKMKERRITVPVVIDDIFNASDFDNTLKLEQFVYTIYKTYDEVLNDDKNLQLILLTHDEMVQGAFRRGIKLRLEQSGKVQLFNNDTYRNYFLCGRLFDREECAKYFANDNSSNFVNLYIEN